MMALDDGNINARGSCIRCWNATPPCVRIPEEGERDSLEFSGTPNFGTAANLGMRRSPWAELFMPAPGGRPEVYRR